MSPSNSEPVQSSPTPASAPATAVDSSSDGLTLATIVDLWSKIRADVKAVNRRIEALLQQVDPAAVNGTQVVLVSPYEFHRNRVNTDEVRQVVESVIGRLVNAKVQVTCVPREDAMRMAGNAASVAQPSPASTNDDSTQPASSLPRAEAPAAQEPEPVSTTTVDVADAEGVPEASRKDDLARITAAKNIFDAEEVTD